MKKDNQGFTLLELIILIAVMSVLVGMMATQYVKYVERAKKAKDMQTADEIAHAYMMAVAVHPEVFDLMEEWRTSKHANLHTTVTATVNGVSESYRVALIVASENTTFTGKQLEYVSGFYDTLNRELNLVTTPGAVNNSMLPQYQVKKSGSHSSGESWRSYSKVDRWRIVERLDTGSIEVWSADGSKYGGWPQFRVWPNADDEYTK